MRPVMPIEVRPLATGTRRAICSERRGRALKNERVSALPALTARALRAPLGSVRQWEARCRHGSSVFAAASLISVGRVSNGALGLAANDTA